MHILVGELTLTRPSLPFLSRGCRRATYVALTTPNILPTERKKGVEHRLSDRTGCVAFDPGGMLVWPSISVATILGTSV